MDLYINVLILEKRVFIILCGVLFGGVAWLRPNFSILIWVLFIL